jgi:hypothetical protein
LVDKLLPEHPNVLQFVRAVVDQLSQQCLEHSYGIM